MDRISVGIKVGDLKYLSDCIAPNIINYIRMAILTE
jgi:hypothetical protein